jgi:hypothetical protein
MNASLKNNTNTSARNPYWIGNNTPSALRSSTGDQYQYTAQLIATRRKVKPGVM